MSPYEGFAYYCRVRDNGVATGRDMKERSSITNPAASRKSLKSEEKFESY